MQGWPAEGQGALHGLFITTFKCHVKHATTLNTQPLQAPKTEGF